jgi:hypothetical protein
MPGIAKSINARSMWGFCLQQLKRRPAAADLQDESIPGDGHG